MDNLGFRQPSSLDDAGLGNGAVPLAGGTDVVPLLRDGLLAADTLVDVRQLVPRGVDGPRIGAATTLAEIEHGDQVPATLREACRLTASPQIRNVGTIAGNLLQATRCWYWRLGRDCWLRGGADCLAREGRSDEHAVFGNDRCASAHPSDPAAALLALGATVHTNRREFPLAELYRLPSDDDREVTTLDPDELILSLALPQPDVSVYLKAMDRNRFAFPLVGVAAARFGAQTRIALAGVAPIPWLFDSFEQASPLSGSAHKIELARALVSRAQSTVDAAQ